MSVKDKVINFYRTAGLIEYGGTLVAAIMAIQIASCYIETSVLKPYPSSAQVSYLKNIK